MYYFDLILLQEWKIEKEEEMRIKMAQSGRYKQVRVNPYSQDIIERIIDRSESISLIYNCNFSFVSVSEVHEKSRSGPNDL